MRELGKPATAFLFTAMLGGNEDLFASAIKALTPHFGDVERESDSISWRHSNYYQEELGNDLLRKFVFFSQPIDPIDLVEAKRMTMEVEKKLGRSYSGGILRNINIDPGYMTMAKLVLASSKDFSHRIYLGQGVHAEVTLYFKDESFRRCRQCSLSLANPRFSLDCAQWCAYAEKCLGLMPERGSQRTGQEAAFAGGLLTAAEDLLARAETPASLALLVFQHARELVDTSTLAGSARNPHDRNS